MDKELIAELYDTEGKKVHLPNCEICGSAKNPVIGKDAFAWICMNGCGGDMYFKEAHDN